MQRVDELVEAVALGYCARVFISSFVDDVVIVSSTKTRDQFIPRLLWLSYEDEDVLVIITAMHAAFCMEKEVLTFTTIQEGQT